jgi:cytochrome c
VLCVKPKPVRWLLMHSMTMALLLSVTVLPVSASTAPANKDAVRGRAIYEAKCSACHSVDENLVGPKHMGVLGRKAGSVNGYAYSDALRQSRIIWTQASLTLWLTEPETLIPGQKMGYRLGLAQERADVVRFLSTLKP